MFSPLKKQREVHSSIIWDKFESVMKSIYRFSKLLAQLLRLSAAHKIFSADAFSAFQLHLLQLERTAAAGNNQLFAVEHLSCRSAVALCLRNYCAVDLEQLALKGSMGNRPWR